MKYRIWRSPYSRFGGLESLHPEDLKDETISAAECYTDETLQEISANGFNGIWVHCVLASVIHLDSFPEFGKNAEKHLESLRILVERAKKHNIKVFLYFQPVRSVAAENHAFWQAHSDCMGQHEISSEQILKENLNGELEMISLCTSVPKVKQWIRDASSVLAKELPELGGVILITASEYPGHCYSHRRKANPSRWSPLIQCPRCREREPWEVAAELVNLVHSGIRRHSAQMEVIAWNWGWTSYVPSPCRPLLEKLPKDVILMAGFERGGYMDLAERPHQKIDEYSLTYDGPSPLCKEVLETAKALGLKRMVKLQLGTTHELASVVNLPLMQSIFHKALWLRENPDVSYLGCWNFGNMFSANTCGFNCFLHEDHPAQEKAALQKFAESYFPSCDSELLIRAWKTFGKAMKHIPFAIPFLYNGVHSHALSYKEIYCMGPLKRTYAGCSYLPMADRGDDLARSLNNNDWGYSPDEVIHALGKLGAIWECGTDLMRDALESCKDDKKELGNAIICGCLWKSTEHAYRAYRLRQNWESEKIGEMRHIIFAELENIRFALPWVEKDDRQGYHGEAHCRFFDPASIREKAVLLEKMLAETEKL